MASLIVSESLMASASLMTTPLLVPISNNGKTKYLVLFDVSGSVIHNKKDNVYVIEIMTYTLFNRFRELGITFFKCIFFGSKNPKMPDGYIIDEGIFTVDNDDGFIDTAKSHADRYNLTCPHFAINNIPNNWLTTKSNENCEVMYVGDGELFDGTSSKINVLTEFSNSITKFLDLNPLIRLSIHAVDVIHQLNTNSENIAGMDVYDSLRNSRLTGRISNFTLYTSTTQKDELFSNKIVPSGYIGYKNQMFISSRENEFFGFIMNEIEQCHNSKIYDIVRHSSSSVSSIIKTNGFSLKISENLINSYSKLFNCYVNDGSDDIICEDLSQMFIRSVHNNLKNQAELSTSFSVDRKKFFEEANAIMANNVKEAIGSISEKGITFPLLDNKIYIVHMCDVTSKLNEKMPYCCYTDKNGTSTPIIPIERRKGKMTNQCMRQTIRNYVSKLYGFPVQSEQAKFVPLVCMVMVYFSDIPENIKKTYIDVSLCMLEKTLTGVNITELEHLRKGNTHSIKSWINDLQQVICNVTKTNIASLSVWYVICKILDETLGDDILSRNQYIHVYKLVVDPSHWRSICSSFPKLQMEEIKSSFYEYICPITHNDTSLGGYYVTPHPWNNKVDGRICNANTVIDKDPTLMSSFIVNDMFSCTICRARLNRSYLNYTEKPISTSTLPVPPKDICAVIVLKGPIGSGKTTLTKILIERLSKYGSVYSANTDRHCARLVKLGANPKSVTRDAINIVSAELNKFIINIGNKFIIMDTCGEKHKDGILFSVNIPTDTWKYYTFYANINLTGITPTIFNNYFAWCMLHVLNRKKDGMGDDYWLNPESAGVDICTKVMFDKSNALFPGKYKLPKFSTIEEANQLLGPMSNEYDMYLKNTYNIETEIQKCINSII